MRHLARRPVHTEEGVQIRIRFPQRDLDTLSRMAANEGITLTTLLNRIMRKAIEEKDAR